MNIFKGELLGNMSYTCAPRFAILKTIALTFLQVFS